MNEEHGICIIPPFKDLNKEQAMTKDVQDLYKLLHKRPFEIKYQFSNDALLASSGPCEALACFSSHVVIQVFGWCKRWT